MAPFAYKTYLVTHYFVLQDYYANELCENKNDASKKCNGLCQLNKELTKSSQESDKENPINFQEVSLSVFLIPEKTKISRAFIESKSTINVEFVSIYKRDFFAQTLKPPRFFC